MLASQTRMLAASCSLFKLEMQLDLQGTSHIVRLALVASAGHITRQDERANHAAHLNERLPLNLVLDGIGHSVSQSL